MDSRLRLPLLKKTTDIFLANPQNFTPMKPTETFKQTIQKYLEERAETDSLFAKSYAKEPKNIDDCTNYILNTVQKSGCNGFTDDEVYSMAVHYYDEDDVKPGKAINQGRVIVNHRIELTPEEMKAAREEAIRKTIEEEQQRLRKPVVHKKDEPINVSQLTFF